MQRDGAAHHGHEPGWWGAVCFWNSRCGPSCRAAPLHLCRCGARSLSCLHRLQLTHAVILFAFRSLCQEEDEADYQFDDGLGHQYFANICGTSKQRCLPPGWLATYELGVAVQFFGDVPPCNFLDPTTLNCVEKVGQIPTCCTADCQVLGVGNPTFANMAPDRAGNPSGIIATFSGAPPDEDDPFWCPWDPSTGQQFPRQVAMQLICDYDVTGRAVEMLAIQNATEDCQYVLGGCKFAATPDNRLY